MELQEVAADSKGDVDKGYKEDSSVLGWGQSGDLLDSVLEELPWMEAGNSS